MKKVLVGMAALAALACQGAFAADQKNYNASECVPYSGASGIRYSYSNIYNTSSSSVLKTDCVAVKDVAGKSISKAWVDVKDLSSSEDVSCRLVSHYNKVGQTGGASWSQYKKTSGINSNWQRLNFTSVGANSSSHYYFSCSVPKRTSNGASWIGTYSVTEKT